MCGICGIISTNDNIAVVPEQVKRMNAKLYHRGPDEDGFFLDKYCCLAMRRLSIIDLAHGKQPIYSSSGNSLVFFNGEIYNYRDLRRELVGLGVKFRTDSDTEVIVNCYEVWGETFVGKLRGMFAFCIYDLLNQRWMLGRDRFGEKPLYYFSRDRYLSFSSELGSLFTDANVSRRLNIGAVAEYLTLSYVAEPYTLVQDVFTLKPGHYMVYQDGVISTRPYFNYSYSVDTSIKDLGSAVERIKPVWETAVKRQMGADVPLGAFLSGGIDSSAVVATMQKFSSSAVKTFTVKFEEESYDESQIARRVAETLGTNHHEVVIRNAGFTKDLFWSLIDKIGLPFPDSSAIPTFYLSKEIGKYVKVALSGDGGDELFAGYNLFHWYSSITKLKAMPLSIRNLLMFTFGIVQSLPVARRVPFLRQIRKAVALSKYDVKEIPIYLHAMFDRRDIERLVPGVFGHLLNAKSYPDDFENWSPLRRIMHFRLVHNLPLDMLTKVDRMSMANSVEVRAPFLDADLFEVAATLPDRHLMKGGTGKLVIREMLKGILPDSVFSHPKKGFSIPLHKYQNGDYWELVHDLLISNSELLQLLSKSELTRVINASKVVTFDNANTTVYKSSHQLWSLLQFAGWMSSFKIHL